MEGIVINIMSKAKKTKAVANLRGHNAQVGKSTGNRDDRFKKYNFDVLEMQGLHSIDNYNKYFKDHAHVGYNAYKEELGEGDFVVPRLNDSVTRVESIIVCPPVKILAKDIDKFDFSEVQLFFDDYIHQFLKQDSKFKDVKILSAKVHCNEVYYPRFEETDIINPDGSKRLRRLSKKESLERAYIKVHMHLDYIPLVSCEKNGIKYLKLSSNDLWKAEKGRYFDSFREFNDRFFASVGRSYGLDRGQKWEEWDERVQKKNNGDKVKKNTRLADWQLDRDEEQVTRYKAQLKQEMKSASEQEKKRLQEELQHMEEESFASFEKIQQSYAREMAIKKAEHKKQIAQMDKEITDKKWELVHQIKEYSEQQLFDMFYRETEDGLFTTARFDEEIRKELQKQLIGKDGKPTQYALDLFKEIKNDPDIASLDAKLIMDKIQTYDRLLRMHGINPDERAIDNIGRDNR